MEVEEEEEEEEEEGGGGEEEEEEDTSKPETVKPRGLSKLLKKGLLPRGASRGKTGDKGKKTS